jgi:redox-sensing transcriptional repressor
VLKSHPSSISRATVDRLPLYFRTLRQLKSEGSDIVSSDELGHRIGVTPEQIRKDLAGFGAFGKKGVGYHVMELIDNIGTILGLDRHWNIAIVGVGHLGWALANYRNFISMGFHLSALFDENPVVVGQIINGVQVSPITELDKIVQEREIQIGIIAVPAMAAQLIADKMVAAGVAGIWNFAPVRIKVPEWVQLVSEDLSVGLSTLSYHLRRQKS